MSETKIYPARRVITMNPSNPFGQAVAVRSGRILGVGSVEELAGWGDHTVDDRFADLVLTPGFVEAHCHAMTGAVWLNPYVGFFDRRAPDGVVWPGCRSIDEVVERLVEVDGQMRADGREDDELLVAWGLDPLYFEGERMYAEHLDRVSTYRPIYVGHVSGHLATVNQVLLDREGINADTPTPGVARRADGHPNGELQEPAAMSLASEAFQRSMASRGTADGILNYGREARNVGLTTVVDLASGPLHAESNELWSSVVDQSDYPARVMRAASLLGDAGADPAQLAERTAALTSSDKLHYGIVKLFLDGSIQGFTARISWPYYYNPPKGAAENGIWLTAPETMADVVEPFHRAGLTVHTHCNGDQATEVFIDAVETVLERYPRWDHRHTVQHCQLTTRAQYRRMAALGMCGNIFTNHLFYWGDQHRDHTVGPERARRMDACNTALQEGVSFSIHSDAPVTPLGPLHTSWCAVNRVTATGDTLGEEERIPVLDAMHAVTIGGAYQIKRDHEIGSIEPGKLADFAVLGDDPLEVDPMTIKDIPVWGTVLGGVPQPAESG
ncbi:MAG: amidohydrolase [Acidimicrobiales bacterium]